MDMKDRKLQEQFIDDNDDEEPLRPRLDNCTSKNTEIKFI